MKALYYAVEPGQYRRIGRARETNAKCHISTAEFERLLSCENSDRGPRHQVEHLAPEAQAQPDSN